jgi:hypothetical protein
VTYATRLTATDPGATTECATAGFICGALDYAWFEKPETAHLACDNATLAVFEEPQLDRRNPKYVIDLAINGALCARAHSRNVRRYKVMAWKGSNRKPQHHARMLKALTPSELKALAAACGEKSSAALLRKVSAACAKGARTRWGGKGASYYGSWKGHNLLDAVALGLFALGRTDKNGKPTSRNAAKSRRTRV